MNESLISCIVPVFDGERYLREAVDSILAQTYRPIEIIVVDDGSTDGTADVVAGYGEQVKYIWQSNAGPAAALNRGLSAAQADYLAFLHADDLWHREKLTRQMARFQSRPILSLCLAHVQQFWVEDVSKEGDRPGHHYHAAPLPGYAGGTLLARRRAFETVGDFTPTRQYGWDLDWFLRAAEVGTVMELLPDVLMYRRLHQTNLSHCRAAESRNEFLQILKASLDHRRRVNRSSPPFYEFPASKQSR